MLINRKKLLKNENERDRSKTKFIHEHLNAFKEIQIQILTG